MAGTFDPFDVERIRRDLAGFMAAQGAAEVAIGPLRRFTVGFSWVTYGLHASWGTDPERVERDLILRIGPPNGIFAPYRASPEFLTLRSLQGSGVPVPLVYWYSDEDEVLGAPFFVCELVDGTAPLPWTHDGKEAFDEERRAAIGGQFLGALAALHRFEWQGTPAAAIGGSTRLDTAAADQIWHWEGLMRRWSARRVPMLEWATAWLKAHAPAASRISIVHGDYRIGNFLESKGRITAILDWELVRLGDPVEDLGWICLQAWRGRSPYMCRLLTRDELLEGYRRLTGIEVNPETLKFWEVFGTFKLAVMHLAATHCFETCGFNDLRMAGMGAQIPRMLLQLESAMERAA